MKPQTTILVALTARYAIDLDPLKVRIRIKKEREKSDE